MRMHMILARLALLALALGASQACDGQADPQKFTDLLNSGCAFAYNQTASDDQTSDMLRIVNQCKGQVANGTLVYIARTDQVVNSMDKATGQAKAMSFYKTELDQVRLADLNPATVSYSGGKVSKVQVQCMMEECVQVQYETQQGRDQPFKSSSLVISMRDEKDAKELASMLRSLIKNAE